MARQGDEAKEMVNRIAKSLGLSHTAVVEMAIRKLARDEFPDEPTKKTAGR